MAENQKALDYTAEQLNAAIGKANSALQPTGGVMTGALALAADPVSDMQAATKRYVDQKVSESGGSGGGSDYVLPTASATVKGGVMVKGVRDNAGYTSSGLVMDGDELKLNWMPINYTNLGHTIENLFPDNITIVKMDFYRYGGLCLFTYQLRVDVAIEGYGTPIAQLPCGSPMRVWLNNSTQFYLDGKPDKNDVMRNKIRMNMDKLNTGNYNLSGIYPTDDDF